MGPGSEGNSAVWKSVHLHHGVTDSAALIGQAKAEPHEHRDCPPQERPWLESRVGEAGTMRPHAFCVTCGTVKNLDGPKARARGFFLSGLSALKEHLERDEQRFKLTQTHSRLISKELERFGESRDTYGLSLSTQIRLYLEAVHRVRPDLEEELVMRLLPKLKATSEKPLFHLLMARTPAGAVQPGY